MIEIEKGSIMHLELLIGYLIVGAIFVLATFSSHSTILGFIALAVYFAFPAFVIGSFLCCTFLILPEKMERQRNGFFLLAVIVLATAGYASGFRHAKSAPPERENTRAVVELHAPNRTDPCYEGFMSIPPQAEYCGSANDMMIPKLTRNPHFRDK